MNGKDDFTMVDFVVNLPFERADGWFRASMPGGTTDRFADELRGRTPKSEDTSSEVAMTDWDWVHRYIRLSDDRTEVQLWFRTDSFISWLMDSHLIRAGERFPEARPDLCKAVEDKGIAGLLPGLRERCDRWRISEAGTKGVTTKALKENLREILTDRFDLEELKDLSENVGVDYQEFPVGKSSFIREFVRYCDRRQRLGELVAAGMKMRMDIEWPRVDS